MPSSQDQLRCPIGEEGASTDAVYTRFIDDYTGVRISASGRRFRIDKAVVWNLVDQEGSIAAGRLLMRGCSSTSDQTARLVFVIR